MLQTKFPRFFCCCPILLITGPPVEIHQKTHHIACIKFPGMYWISLLIVGTIPRTIFILMFWHPVPIADTKFLPLCAFLSVLLCQKRTHQNSFHSIRCRPRIGRIFFSESVWKCVIPHTRQNTVLRRFIHPEINDPKRFFYFFRVMIPISIP